MWDILDISSSSSFAETSRLGDLVPQTQQTMDEGMSLRSPDQSFMAPPPELFVGGPVDRRTSLGPSFPPGMSPLPRVGHDPMEEGALPEWPFATREGSAGLGPPIPDIPDWMLFGRYLPEQL